MKAFIRGCGEIGDKNYPSPALRGSPFITPGVITNDNWRTYD